MLELLQGQLPCPGFENWLFLDLFGIVLKNILFVQTFMITVSLLLLISHEYFVDPMTSPILYSSNRPVNHNRILMYRYISSGSSLCLVLNSR